MNAYIPDLLADVPRWYWAVVYKTVYKPQTYRIVLSNTLHWMKSEDATKAYETVAR